LTQPLNKYPPFPPLTDEMSSHILNVISTGDKVFADVEHNRLWRIVNDIFFGTITRQTFEFTLDKLFKSGIVRKIDQAGTSFYSIADPSDIVKHRLCNK
jgi:hypothetical protein